MPEKFPIERYLTPATPTQAPEGFTMIEQALSGGLPAPIPLTAELTLVIGIPTGVANAWREADPQATVTSSLAQWQPYEPPGSGAPPQPMIRGPLLILLRSGTVIASVAALAGQRRLLPAGGQQVGTLLELYVSAWDVRAAAILGGGDTVSRIRFGWRAANLPGSQFTPPPISPSIVSRLRDRHPPQSELGGEVARAGSGYGTVPAGRPLPPEYFGARQKSTGLPLGWERL